MPSARRSASRGLKWFFAFEEVLFIFWLIFTMLTKNELKEQTLSQWEIGWLGKLGAAEKGRDI